jgi:hypothetical protein
MLRLKTLAALGAAAMILAPGSAPASAAVTCSASSPCINIKNTSVVEPDGAIPRPAEFEVTLSRASPLAITVWFVTSERPSTWVTLWTEHMGNTFRVSRSVCITSVIVVRVGVRGRDVHRWINVVARRH